MALSPAHRFALQSFVWGLYLALSLLGVSAYTPLASGVVAIFMLVAMGLWIGSEAWRALVLRQGWLDRPRYLLTFTLLIPPLLALAIQLLASSGSLALLASGHLSMPAGSKPPSLSQRAGYIFNTTIMLWLWCGCWVAWRYAQRWRNGEIARWKGEAERRALELEVLRGQMNPHFIFNALNNLRALINQDPARARDAVSQLAGMLRRTLVAGSRERVSLADELALVRDYVAVEQLQYEERLQVRWFVAPDQETTEVPPMVLQLLVENAIKHGIAPLLGGGVINICITPDTEDPARLRITVDSPGIWAETASTSGTGIGMMNLRQRLARMAGAECGIGERDGRVEVALLLPSTVASVPSKPDALPRELTA
jgi:two-component sensor histidine kinase